MRSPGLLADACPIARTAALLHDPWTVLLVRDLAAGIHRFDNLVEHLEIARNVLARRLAELAAAGVVERVDYREPGQRVRQEYHLTDSGHELDSVLQEMKAWGARHLPGPTARHR